jgi:hypothetical protein
MIRSFALPVALALIAPALLLTTPIEASGQERVGTSCADCPNYGGAFSIDNQTGVTVRYRVKWGADSNWKAFSLNTGHTETHTYSLGEDRNGAIPTPYVSFDRIAGDSAITLKEYRMLFNRVGYGGFGSTAPRAEPKKYFFEFSADRTSLDIHPR